MPTFGKKGPTEEDFETCVDVLSWLISWFEENSPGAVEIDILKGAELEIPESVAELYEDEEED